MSLLRSRISAFTILAVLCVVGGNAVAQERVLHTSELIRQADVVVVGKVSEVRSAWNKNRTRIQTAVTVAVDQALKGGGGGSLTIVTPGGEVDGVGEYYSHSARFTKDEEVVVFARKDPAGQLRVTGGEQGKVGIKKDETTGIRTVAGDVTLDAFIARVKEATLEVTR